jgi:hypothetical protein
MHVITKTRPEANPAEPTQRGPHRRWVAIALVVVLLGVGFLGVRAWTDHPADIRDGTTLVDEQGLAAEYGINVNLIAVTAAGGLIDFRYQVVDPDKADQIIHDIDLYPKLIEEGTGATLAVTSLPHNHATELKLGGHYFFLLANANNAITKGSTVTVVIGDVRLEHVVVQG